MSKHVTDAQLIEVLGDLQDKADERFAKGGGINFSVNANNKLQAVDNEGDPIGIGSGGSGGDASDIAYDNTTSGLTATNVQDAIDEIATKKSNFLGGWLEAANIDPEGYESLSDILEDELAIRKLFTIHASVDYLCDNAELIDSTDLSTVFNDDYVAKWINLRDYALDTLYANTIIKDYMDAADKYFYGEWALMPQVPTMTSNTAPYGEVIYTGTMSYQNYPYYMFDDDLLKGYITNETSNVRFGYKFTEPKRITKIMYCGYNDTSSGNLNDIIREYKIQYSNDGSNWTDVYSGIFEKKNGEQFVEFENNVSALYWSITNISNQGPNPSRTLVMGLQFYAWQPKGNVPVMTSNTTPYGEVFASSYTDNRVPWWAFDNDQNTVMEHQWTSDGDIPCYIGYKFINPIKVKEVYWKSLYTSTYPNVPKTYKIQGSNDGTNWIDLYSGTTQSYSENSHKIKIENENYYLYYRMYITATWRAQNYVGIDTLQFYGREMKVSVPTMTSNTAPYGEVFDYAHYANYQAYYAFDKGETSTTNLWHGTQDSPNYVGYKFKKPVCVKFVYIRDDLRPFNNFYENIKVQGSNDNFVSDVHTLHTINNYKQTAGLKTYISLDNNDGYKSYRLYLEFVSSGDGGNPGYMCIQEINFYGFDYSEYDWDTYNPRHYIYDHGVELEALDVNNNINGSEYNSGIIPAIKQSDCLEMNVVDMGTWKQSTVTSPQINVTNYNLAFVRLGKKVAGMLIAVHSVKTSSTTSPMVRELKNANMGSYANMEPVLHSLDISFINQNMYLSCSVYNGSNSYNSMTGLLQVDEWWLE